MQLVTPRLPRNAPADYQTCLCTPQSGNDIFGPRTLSESWSASRQYPSCKLDLLSFHPPLRAFKIRMPEPAGGLLMPAIPLQADLAKTRMVPDVLRITSVALMSPRHHDVRRRRGVLLHHDARRRRGVRRRRDVRRH